MRGLGGISIHDPDRVPYLVDEAAGPLEVWRGAVLVRAYPWHSAQQLDGGKLYVIDVPTGRLVGEHEPGTWTRVCNASADGMSGGNVPGVIRR